jgi:hypothetical protein
MRAFMTAAVIVAASAAPAFAWVPPFKGNDTGGIISWHSYPPEVIRDMAFAHCASWGKAAKLTGVQARYGGYVSFACFWRPTVVTSGVVVRALN